MAQFIGFEPDRHSFGVIVFPQTGVPFDTLCQKLGAALGAQLAHKRKGWFGPRQYVLVFHSQTAAIEISDSGDVRLDISSMDDETREVLLEALYQSGDFDRI